MAIDSENTLSRSPCVICGEKTEHFIEKHGIQILRCRECGHLFADCGMTSDHVETVYSNDYFFGGKDGYPNYLDEASMLEARGKKYAKRISQFCEPGEHLDVGAAAGFILRGFEIVGWKSTGLEPNEEMVRFGTQELGLNLVQGTLEDCNLTQRFDLITLIQVVAHLHDLKKAFSKLRELTRDGGLILIETWNQGSLTARAMGKNWHEYSPPSVLHWFTPHALTSALEPYGFEKVAQGRTLKWISLRHAMSLSSHVFGSSAAQKMQDKVPSGWRVPYPSEDLFWAVYRAAG